MAYALKDPTVKKVVAVATVDGKSPVPNYVKSIDLDAILATERERKAARIDEVCDLNGLRFVAAGPKDIALTGDYAALKKPKTLNSIAEYHVATKLGVPSAFFSKCSSDLKLQILGEHGGPAFRPDSKTRKIDGVETIIEKQTLVRIDYDGRVRALLSPGYVISDNIDLIDATIKLLNQGGATAAYMNIGDTFMHARILFPNKEQTLGTSGDRIVPGVQARNSEVGLSSYAWETALFRAQCWNGMIFTEQGLGGILQRHTGKASVELFGRLDDAMQKIIENAPALVERCSIAATKAVEDAEEYVRAAAGRYGIPKNMVPAILANAAEAQADTVWDYVNAITATAQGRDLDTRIAIERAAGKMLAGLKN